MVTREELLTATDNDPFVRCEIPVNLPDPAWTLGYSALLVRASHSRGPGMTAIGSIGDICSLLAQLAGDPLLADIRTLTVRRTALPSAAEVLHLGEAGNDWDWMWTDVAPPRVAGEDRLVRLDDARDAAELNALNALSNPTAESEPGTGRTELWLGVLDSAEAIIAAGALHRTAAGVPHLTGIITHPRHRRSGFGAAVTAGLTRAAVKLLGPTPGVSTLGMYAGNDDARRLYHRLGYRTAHEFSSRQILPHRPTAS